MKCTVCCNCCEQWLTISVICLLPSQVQTNVMTIAFLPQFCSTTNIWITRDLLLWLPYINHPKACKICPAWNKTHTQSITSFRIKLIETAKNVQHKHNRKQYLEKLAIHWTAVIWHITKLNRILAGKILDFFVWIWLDHLVNCIEMIDYYYYYYFPFMCRLGCVIWVENGGWKSYYIVIECYRVSVILEISGYFKSVIFSRL